MSTGNPGPEEALVELRRRVHERRINRRLTAAQLAGLAGVSRTTLYNFSNGAVPRESTVEALGRALGMDVNALHELRRIAAGEGEGAARAERPLRNAVVGRPAVPAPAPAEDRLLALFQTGSAVGSALTLQLTASGRFEDFLGSLRRVGLSEAETAQLREIRTLLEQIDPPGRDILIACGRVVEGVVGLVEERTTRAEFRWFEFGKLLQGIALFAAMAWPAAPDLDEARTELFYLSDALDMPEELRAEVKNYCRAELPTAEQREMLEEAERLSRAFHAIRLTAG
ncbi:helix-turn-helix transcriptional regulator [Streptomyces sp. BK340]|uniref:helix-turn-helix transcriptional regulator n=1 Tax=Streptomyces sp. BK340 TaxID=2572903 RepID=UPI0011A33D2B|nr:helix-turn-helix transcriptional regulator [Streptomyces sp. BK340]TVZ76881.1 DNA-binding XRE family transcriptional regulator [Streptomyces sp. BK340]